jgi:hypothetical protein
MRSRCGVILALIVVFLILLPLLTIFLRENELSTAQPVKIGSSFNHLSSKNDQSSPFLKETFFPKEPRLEDAQPISSFAPTGIASYGSTGVIQTNSVRGITTVREIGLGFFSAELINNSQAIPYVGTGNGSLQENSVLWLGNLGTYWIQNVVSITENSLSSYTLQLINNIWNFTSLSSNMNQNAVSGSGNVQCETLNEATSCAYIKVDSQIFTVTAPFTVTLTMSIANTSNGAVSILFLYQIQDPIGDNFSGQYDDATLFPSSPKITSYFQIGGESPVSETLGGGTSLTLPSDLELVFGGPGGGSSVFVNSISGSQQLLYLNGGSYASVPDSFSVGSDTGEQASGISVAGDFANSALPSDVLSSGTVSPQQLWPLPITFLIRGNNEFGNSTLKIEGQVLYSLGLAPNTAVLPGTNLTIQDSLTGKSKITDANGVFNFPFRASHEGTYHDNISFPGSISFEKSSLNLQIAVSSINITGAGSALIAASVNGSQFVTQNENQILVPVIQGTTLVVTFENVTTDAANQQEHFQGFSTGQYSIVLNGNSPVSTTANFASGSIGSLLSSYLIYGIIGSLALVFGIVIGYLLRGRATKWNSLPTST